jgi:hypothetical protein
MRKIMKWMSADGVKELEIRIDDKGVYAYVDGVFKGQGFGDVTPEQAAKGVVCRVACIGMRSDKKAELDALASEIEADKKERIEKALAADIIGFKYEMGCDASDTEDFIYNFPDGLEFDAKYERIKKDKDLAHAIGRVIYHKASNQKLWESLGWKQITSSGSTYGGWELNAEQVAPIMEEVLVATEKRKAAADKRVSDEKERIAAIFTKAKETGERQLLEKYMDDCNDPEEECSTDAVTVWAMPDGSRKTNRQHTW